jgi:transcription elongation factor S-II
VNCAIREKVLQIFGELFESADTAAEFESHILKSVSEHAKKEGVDVDWSNRTFWNMYRNRALTLYENLRGKDSYVQNDYNLLEKIRQKEFTLQEVAEMTQMDMCPSRWKAVIERQIAMNKQLYSKNKNASIVMRCSSCKKQTNCDYYEMQTRSADEPMTTFVTCLECDRRWKF